MIIKVKIGSNTDRKDITVDNSSTIKEVLVDNEINYTTTTMMLDGAPLTAGEINKTFAELGITDSCYLLAVVKASNAR